MALASLSKSLLSRMSLSGPGTGSVPSLATSTSAEMEPVSSLAIVGGNHREASVTDDASFLSSGFSPIRNMELYPPRAKVIEEGCSSEECPLPLLAGESVEYLCALLNGHLLHLTNYRLIATQEQGFYSVPLGLIEGIEMQAVKETLTFLCRDSRTFRLIFPSPFKARSFLSHIQQALHPPSDSRNIFAFVHTAYCKDLRLAGGDDAGVGPFQGVVGLEDTVTEDYSRMGILGSAKVSSTGGHGQSTDGMKELRVWRVSQCNSKYEVCPTYPKLLIVPQCVSDEDLVQVSKFRMLGRLPVVVWRHPVTGCVIARSSQPLVGVLSWRSSEDEKILNALSQACWDSRSAPLTTPQETSNGVPTPSVNGSISHTYGDTSGRVSPAVPWDVELEERVADSAPRLVVMDLRSYTATLGNRAKGGGSECTDYYPNCDVHFKGLPNIHTVRKSFQNLRTVLASEDQSSFLSNLENSQWLSFICQLMGVACEVVSVVHDSAHPILIHCSDGWDRTTQVVALAQLMLDPYYRTIKGFQVLVEREWLSFGHKFGDRCGHSSEDTNQRSPVFLQWLDCVHQLTRQFPCDFQFNELFLLKLGRHVYSCLFGTFLGNSLKERESWRVQEDTTSVWNLLHPDNVQLTNCLYEPLAQDQLKVLKPMSSIQSMLLWRAMYSDPPLSLYLDPRPLHSEDRHLGGENGTNAVLAGVHNEGPEKRRLSMTKVGKGVATPAGSCARSGGYAFAQGNGRYEPGSKGVSVQLGAGGKTAGSRKELVEGLQRDVVMNATVEAGGVEGKEALLEEPASDTVHIRGSFTLSGDNGEAGVTLDEKAFSVASTGSEANSKTEAANVDGEAMDSANRREVVTELQVDEVFCVDGKITPEEVQQLGSRHSDHDFHESLHVFRSESATAELKGAGSNHTTPVEAYHWLPDGRCGIDGDEQLTIRHLPPPSSMIEMLPMEKDASSRNFSLAAGLVNAMQDDKGVEEHEMSLEEHSALAQSKFNVDVDGLPSFADSVHVRLKELEAGHKAELRRLQQKLKEARTMVALAVQPETVSLVSMEKEGLGAEDQEATESVCSIASWDYVDEDGEGVRWIPDHAVTHCFGCDKEFWAALRKHHCRSCGKVFCCNCSDYFCQVPKEQLFEDVRVCEKCFYKLDGHLQRKLAHSHTPG